MNPTTNEDMSKYMDAFNHIRGGTERFQKTFAQQEKLRLRREQKEMRSHLLEKQAKKIIESGERTPSQPNNSPVDETEGFPFGGRTAAGAKIRVLLVSNVNKLCASKLHG